MKNNKEVSDNLLKLMSNINQLVEKISKVDNEVVGFLEDNNHLLEVQELLSIKKKDETDRKQGKEVNLDKTIKRYQSIINKLDKTSYNEKENK